MAIQLRKAERKQAKLRIGISAPSGGGKTYSALLLAKGLVGDWTKVALIDTENGSGELYSHLGEYNVITLEAPFTPERYIEAIVACENAGMEAIVIDSATHEWDGKGGCLEIMESLGGRYQDWSKVTPRHRKFLDAILQSSAHIITTTRRKQDYTMDKGQDGKMNVTKVGMKEVQREGFEYELTVAFDVDIRHNAKASKDRTGLFMDQPEFVIEEATGLKLKEWAESGKNEKNEIISQILKTIEATGESASEKTLAFLDSQKVSSLKHLLASYEKKLEEYQKNQAQKDDPANPNDIAVLRQTLTDIAIDIDYFEKQFGTKLDDMKKGQVEAAYKWIDDFQEKAMETKK